MRRFRTEGDGASGEEARRRRRLPRGGWREAAGRAVCLGRMYDMRVDSSVANRHASFTSREYLTTALRASNATDTARAFATTGRA